MNTNGLKESFVLKMEAAGSSETLEAIYEISGGTSQKTPVLTYTTIIRTSYYRVCHFLHAVFLSETNENLYRPIANGVRRVLPPPPQGAKSRG
jgi:hypothetical protein